MGLNHDLATAIRGCYGHRAYSHVHRFQDKYKTIPHANVMDTLVHLMHSLGPRGNYLYTGVELYESFMRPTFEAFEHGAVICVSIVDDEDNKTKRKGFTMAKRVKQSASSTPEITPYDINTYSFHTGGLFHNDSHTTDYIDLRRLKKSKHLYNDLWSFLCNRLLGETRIPEGKIFAFEFSRDADVFILPVKEMDWSSKILPPRGDPFYDHMHGEADPSCMHWAGYFIHHKHLPTVIQSIDSDFIALYIAYQAACPANDSIQDDAELYWANATDSIVSMQLLAKDLIAATSLNASQLLAFLMFCGTDFMQRNQYANGFQFASVLNVFRKHKDYASLLFYPEKAQQAFDFLLRALYTYGRNREVIQEMTALRAYSSTSTMDSASLPIRIDEPIRSNNDGVIVKASASSKSMMTTKRKVVKCANLFGGKTETKKKTVKRKLEYPDDDSSSSSSCTPPPPPELKPPLTFEQITELLEKKAAKRRRKTVKPHTEEDGDDADADDEATSEVEKEAKTLFHVPDAATRAYWCEMLQWNAKYWMSQGREI